jgi:hypothetical protein
MNSVTSKPTTRMTEAAKPRAIEAIVGFGSKQPFPASVTAMGRS